MQLAKMSFDKVFDLTAGVFLFLIYFVDMCVVCDWLKTVNEFVTVNVSGQNLWFFRLVY